MQRIRGKVICKHQCLIGVTAMLSIAVELCEGGCSCPVDLEVQFAIRRIGLDAFFVL